ncbi:YihY/virulence factor BrkB family protein [Frankia sp. AiPs1]|uniref:YihY/virulence factor BrkB family protein n=1 Tax=Frankia sp. AiPs1 TaxID=573493 RepID=UPI0035ABBBD2
MRGRRGNRRITGQRAATGPDTGADAEVEVGGASAVETGSGAATGQPPATVMVPDQAMLRDQAVAAVRAADGPGQVTELPRRSWFGVLRRTVREFMDDDLPDRAAALTYYSVLAVFPALLVLVSLVGLLGRSTTDRLLDNIEQLTPGAARDILHNAVNGLRDSAGSGGVVAIVSLAGALWSASGYIAAFIRAANAVYDMPEGRPVWKIAPLRLLITITLVVLLAVSSMIVVFSGALAEQAGTAIGLGHEAITAWSIAKWPVLVLIVTAVIALLYWSTPNVRPHGFRWLTPGSVLAVVIWLVASGAFAFYVATFGSYNKTYGTLAGVIVFLIWLWLSNLAILLGLELDAEIARARAIAAGLDEGVEPYVEPRDTRAWPRPRRRVARN